MLDFTNMNPTIESQLSNNVYYQKEIAFVFLIKIFIFSDMILSSMITIHEHVDEVNDNEISNNCENFSSYKGSMKQMKEV